MERTDEREPDGLEPGFEDFPLFQDPADEPAEDDPFADREDERE